MRRLLLVALGVVFAWAGWPLHALDLPADHIVITEIQTGSVAQSGEEFVELHNPTDEPLDLTGWTLEYKSAAGSDWMVKSTLSGFVQPRGFYLIASSGYLSETADAVMSSGLAAGGGHIRLAENETVHDLVGWGTADSPEQTAVSAPPAGHSVKRRLDADGRFVDNDDNGSDFALSDTPEPQSTPAPLLPEEPEDSTEYAPVVISELLPDPVAPQTDAADEFVELYNPGDQPIDLTGYKIQFGSMLQSGFVLDGIVLGPGEYAVFNSADTSLALTNGGSKVQVLDPTGAIAGQLVGYEAAPAGQTWSLLAGSYEWTDAATPGSANQPTAGIGDEEGDPPTSAPQVNYPKLTLTEVFPDPASPQADARDEFVELYNPNSSAVNAAGYVLKSGSTLRTAFVLPDVTVAPGAYVAFFSADANISLGNSGSSVQLIDPNGLLISEIKPYDKAEEGQSWALIDGAWRWTAAPTPAARNTYEAAPAKVKKARKSRSRRGVFGKSSGILGAFEQPAAAGQNPPNWRLITGVGVLTAGYMSYELRHDIRNQLHRLRRFIPGRTGKP
jgi:hypothetical protein